MLEIVETETEEQDTPPADAVETVTDYVNGFAIRHCKGKRPFLNWQAGILVTEKRFFPVCRAGGLCDWQTVSVFRLLGYGETRDEAVQMAKRNENGRTR